jgi:glucose/arabinose dehydrogenase
MPRSVRLALLTVALLAMPAAAGAAVTVPTGFDQRVLAAGISQPTQVAWAPDGRMFVAEKPGRIRVVTAAGALLTAPLMDITARVNSQQDRGLLGIALSPTFAVDHQLFYVFTYELQPGTPDSDAPMVARVERVTVNADNTVSAPTVVLGTDVSGPCPRVSDTCMPSDGRSHSIGTIRFGPDGTLWIGLGDSADYNVVDELAFRAQEEGVMSGKLLHVDTSGRGLPGHPFCPSETDLTKTCTRLYAKGFRNPYRFTITAGGVPLVGDVGWGSREELDRVVAGGNYGWPCWEGDRQTTGYSADARCTALYAAQTAKAPLHTYSHDNANAAIVGGPVMPADTPFGADYAGDVFFGDYAKGFVQRLDLAADGTCTTTPCTVRSFATGWVGTDLELSPARNLAWTLFGTGGPDGSVVEVLPTASGNRTPVARATVTPLAGSAGRGYRFGAGTSTDPDGDPLTATWDFGDGTAAQAGTDVEHVFAAGVTSATVTLTVADGRGATATDTDTVHPGDAPPVPQIRAGRGRPLHRRPALRPPRRRERPRGRRAHRHDADVAHDVAPRHPRARPRRRHRDRPVVHPLRRPRRRLPLRGDAHRDRQRGQRRHDRPRAHGPAHDRDDAAVLADGRGRRLRRGDAHDARHVHDGRRVPHDAHGAGHDDERRQPLRLRVLVGRRRGAARARRRSDRHDAHRDLRPQRPGEQGARGDGLGVEPAERELPARPGERRLDDDALELGVPRR